MVHKTFNIGIVLNWICQKNIQQSRYDHKEMANLFQHQAAQMQLQFITHLKAQ